MNGQVTVSRELALRIGLAARALPDVDTKRLLLVLVDCLGLPITEDKLAGLSLAQLKSGQDGELSEFDGSLLSAALTILQTDPNAEPQSAALQAYSEGDMPGSVRIACASDDGVNIDGHFGACKQFRIYQVSAEEVRLIDIRHTNIPEGLEVDDKNAFRAELIQDCKVLYVASVGGPAAAKIVKLGIHPMKLADIEAIADIIGQLQSVIAGTPPPWLAKAMGIEASDRFRFEREATG